MDNQCVIAIATVVEDVLLLGNAILVFLYLQATKDIAERNRQQVTETQQLVEAAQKQLAVSQEQIRISLREAEAQIRPVLVVDKGPEALGGATVARTLAYVQNVGNGPALNVRLSIVGTNQSPNWNRDVSEPHFLSWDGISIEKGIDRSRAPLVLPNHTFGNRLNLKYTSMSGKAYITEVFIDNAGVPHETRFLEQ